MLSPQVKVSVPRNEYVHGGLPKSKSTPFSCTVVSHKQIHVLNNVESDSTIHYHLDVNYASVHVHTV